MVGAAPRHVPDAAGAVEPGSDYFATEAHYLSVAGRIVGALRAGNLVVVAGDPSGDHHALSEALHTVAPSHRTVIEVPWSPELTADTLAQAGSVLATTATGEGTAEPPKTPEGIPPLFVFGEAERFSERQLEEICDAVQRGARKGAVGVLLARTSLLARLEDPSLSFLKAALAGQFRFDEIGEDESINFLRHQIASRQPGDAARGISPGLVRALAALAVLSTTALGALLAVHYLPVARPPATESPPAELPLPPQAASGVAKPAPAQPTPAPPMPTLPPTASPPSAAPSPADPGLSPTEVTALLTRGDGLLSTGDIASARLFYERAADAGVGAAALRLGATFDAGFLGRIGVRGTPGDPAQAAAWYRRARDLGTVGAGERLDALEQQPRAAPDAPAR